MNIARFISVSILLVNLSACSSIDSKTSRSVGSSHDKRVLVAPWEVSTFRPGPTAEGFMFSICKPVEPVVKNIDVPIFYTDASYSVIDPELRKRYNQGTLGIRNFLIQISDSANAFLYGKSEDAARCATNWLSTWAEADALLGTMAVNPTDKSSIMQGKFVRKWALAGIATAYLKIRNSEVVTNDQNRFIKSWIQKVALEVQMDYLNVKDTNSKNNHAYWAGVAVITSAVAINDSDLFQWGVGQYKIGVDQIEDDGTLPFELARGKRALFYHYFSLTPLMIIAEYARVNGVDLYSYKENRIDLLSNLLLAALNNSHNFSNFVRGIRMELDPWTSYGWVELVFRRTKDQRAVEFLKIHRPVIDFQLKDNMTAVFGEEITN